MMGIRCSAPCRIDIGGSWDMDMFSLPYVRENLHTITIALNLRTHISIEDYQKGFIKLQNGNDVIEQKSKDMVFEGKYGLINAILSHLGVDGKFIKIQSDYPPISGLGGSGVLSVALIYSLICQNIVLDPYQRNRIIKLAHDIEAGMRFSYTGYQDQCAAMYGGVMLWKWNYESIGQSILLNKADVSELESRLVIAYTGKQHLDINEKQVKSFISGEYRKEWLKINEITTECIEAFKEKDWDLVSKLVSEENKIRIKIVPERISKEAQILYSHTEDVGEGFGICGSGGSVFYLGPDPEKAKLVKSRWRQELINIPEARLLPSVVDFEGLRYDT